MITDIKQLEWNILIMLSTLHKKITIFVGMTITLIGGALFFWKR